MAMPCSIVVIRFNQSHECIYLDSTIGDEDRQGNIPTYTEKIWP